MQRKYTANRVSLPNSIVKLDRNAVGYAFTLKVDLKSILTKIPLMESKIIIEAYFLNSFRRNDLGDLEALSKIGEDHEWLLEADEKLGRLQKIQVKVVSPVGLILGLCEFKLSGGGGTGSESFFSVEVKNKESERLVSIDLEDVRNGEEEIRVYVSPNLKKNGDKYMPLIAEEAIKELASAIVLIYDLQDLPENILWIDFLNSLSEIPDFSVFDSKKTVDSEGLDWCHRVTDAFCQKNKISKVFEKLDIRRA